MAYIGAGINQTKTSVENSKDEFFSTYYGQAATDPTVDPIGNAPTEGDIYFNTTDKVLKAYDGSAWIDWSLLGDQDYGLITTAATTTVDYGAIA